MKKLLKFIILPVMVLLCVTMIAGCSLSKNQFEIDYTKSYVGITEAGTNIKINFFAGDYLILKGYDDEGYVSDSFIIEYTVDNTLGYTRIVGRLYGEDENGNIDPDPGAGLTITECTKNSIKILFSTYVYQTDELICYATNFSI